MAHSYITVYHYSVCAHCYFYRCLKLYERNSVNDVFLPSMLITP